MAALNLGVAGSAPAVAAQVQEAAWWGWGVALVPVAVTALLVWRLAPPQDRRPGPAGPWDLAAWPVPARLAVFLFLVATGLTHAFAAGAIFEATRVNYHGNAEYFRYMSLLQLFRMSHQHAFGHGTMYLLVGLLLAGTRADDRLKVAGIALTSVGALSDLASWWLQKFLGPSFEPLSMAAGACFAAGFALSALCIIRELLRRKPI
jgi:hypothetical protein